MNGWKITAIIFIVLFIAETLLFAWIINLGIKDMNRKSECNVNVCNGYDAFIYDSLSQVCYCYKNNEIAYQEFIK